MPRGFGIKNQKSCSVYPFKVWTEQSQIDRRLVRLCLGHVESDKYKILETYYPDEVNQATRSFIAQFAKVKSRYSVATIESNRIDISIDAMVEESRSTKQYRRQLREMSPGRVISIT